MSSGDTGLQKADMLSGQNFRPQNAKNEKVSEQDLEYLENVTKKLKNGHSYSAAEASHLLDYMFDMDPETGEKLPDKSLFMNSKGEICVYIHTYIHTCANDRQSNIHLVNEWEREIEHTPSATQEPDHWSVTSCQAHLLAAMVLVQVSDNMGILLAPPSDICPNSGSAHKPCHITIQVNAKAITDRLRTPGEVFANR